MWKNTLICLWAICLTVLAKVHVRDSKLVNIEQGPVRGYKDPDSGIYFFQSIPYASAPTGSNRFKAPLPPPTWVEPLEAISKAITCPQSTSSHGMQENCLIASVYVPDIEEKDLPVVVYVHGGAFHFGSGDSHIPSKFVMEHNIIAVTFNYRLSTHGFLCLGTEDIPGNAGMKDQIAALRWVKKNIVSFGGNPDDVTIQGSSAGAAAVDLLMLSKSAEGLFHRVIPESGASIAQSSIQPDPLENARWFGRYLNFTNLDDIYALEDFYKRLPYNLLTNVPYINRTDSIAVFSPCIERATKEEVFLDASPVDILINGNYRKYPMLYGITNMEGSVRMDQFDLWKNKMNEKFSNFLSGDLKFESDDIKDEVAKQIKEFYFGNEPVGENNILSYIDLFTDVLYAYPMLRSVKYHIEAGHGQIYLYEYSFVDDKTPVIPNTRIKRAAHCAQTAAFFGGIKGIVDPNNPTDSFLDMSSMVRKIWANFIRISNPVPAGSSVPSWPAVTRSWPPAPHMSLGAEFALRDSLLERRASFWDRIYSQHYRHPIPPPEPKSTQA